jgi:glutamate racemase
VLVWGCTHFEAFDKVLRETLAEVLIDEKITINPLEIVFIMPGNELAYEIINSNNLVGLPNNHSMQNQISPMHFTNDPKKANGDIPLAYRYLGMSVLLQYWGEE